MICQGSPIQIKRESISSFSLTLCTWSNWSETIWLTKVQYSIFPWFLSESKISKTSKNFINSEKVTKFEVIIYFWPSEKISTVAKDPSVWFHNMVLGVKMLYCVPQVSSWKMEIFLDPMISIVYLLRSKRIPAIILCVEK